jgi:hypothetical protein
MRRVKDQDEESKDPGTRGPRDQRTRGAEDQGTKGPGDQRIRGTLNYVSSKFIFVPRVLVFFSRKLRLFFQYHPQKKMAKNCTCSTNSTT